MTIAGSKPQALTNGVKLQLHQVATTTSIFKLVVLATDLAVSDLAMRVDVAETTAILVVLADDY